MMARQRKDRPDLYGAFGTKAAPAPGQRGHRPLDPERAAAEDTAQAAIRLWTDGEAGWHVQHAVRAAWEVEDLFPDEAPEDPFYEPDDLPILLGQPDWSPQDAASCIEMVAELLDQFMPHALVREIVADKIHPAGKLRLVNVPKDDAFDFIRQHHSAMPEPNPRGLMYALGVMKGGRLVAVATAGAPTGRWGGERGVDVHNVVELTRVASDGTTKGAASKLVARLLDLLPDSKRGPADGPALFVTYSLTSEAGTTYRALADKGLRPVALTRGKKQGGGGARAGGTLGYAEPDKIRWEAGPAAMPARWDLLDLCAQDEEEIALAS